VCRGARGWLGGGDGFELFGEAGLASGGGVGVDDAVAGGGVQGGLGFAYAVGGVVCAIGDGEARIADGVGGAGANGLVAFGTGDVLSDALARGEGVGHQCSIDRCGVQTSRYRSRHRIERLSFDDGE